MTATGMHLHLRRPDGAQLDAADAAAMEPGTLLVVEVAAALTDATTLIEGQPPTPAAIATVIGWVVPANAPFGRTMLLGAVEAVSTAVAQLDGRHAAPVSSAGPAGAGRHIADSDQADGD